MAAPDGERGGFGYDPERARYIRSALWPEAGDAQWADWRWQLAHRIREPEQLEPVLSLGAEERAAWRRAAERLPVALTPYWASLMHPEAPDCPIRAQSVPRAAELVVDASEQADPLAEETHMPVAGLTHRYPDRVLIYVSHHCAVYCRHCNRRRKVGDAASAPSRDALRGAVVWLCEHPEVRDVLVSGGDPLSLSDERFVALLKELRAVEHVEIIRVATRVPVTLPQRITPALVELLRPLRPLYVNTQFNHLAECTPEAARALELLADAGCVLGNQMVLLAGVNDDPQMVRRMNQWLLRQRCRPYYIFQCDPADGTRHFRAPVSSGLAIIEALRGWTSGLAVPQFVVDLPGGGGKAPLTPAYLVGRHGRTLTFRNYRGELYTCEDG